MLQYALWKELQYGNQSFVCIHTIWILLLNVVCNHYKCTLILVQPWHEYFFFQKSEYIQNPFLLKVFVFITNIQSNTNKITFSATKLFHPLVFGILRWWANNAVASRWPFFSNDYIWVFSSVFIIPHHLIFSLLNYGVTLMTIFKWYLIC